MAERIDLEEVYPGLLARLGKEPDSALGKEYGISGTRVGQFRQREEIPPFIIRRRDAQPTFINQVFHYLRDLWEAAHPDETLVDLARVLGVSKRARLSAWATGSNNRTPSWDLLVRLAGLTGHSLELDLSGVTIRKGKRAVYSVARPDGESF